MSTDIPILIRNAKPDDYRFIFHSWARSFSVSHFVRDLGLSEWLACKSYASLLEKRLHEMQVLIACNPEDETQIFGYLVYEYHQPITAVHFLYVKDYLRSEGIAKELIKALKYDAPYLTYSYFGSGKIARHLFPSADFNPFHFLGVFITDPKETKAYDSVKESVSVSGN